MDLEYPIPTGEKIKHLMSPKNCNDFEGLCHKLWSVKFDPECQFWGRQGQDQSGIDLYGTDRRTGKDFVVQCKKKEIYGGKKLNFKKDIQKEIESALQNDSFSSVRTFYIATTALRDVKIQQQVIELNQKLRDRGTFEIVIKFWDDLNDWLNEHRDIAELYYGKFLDFKTPIIDRIGTSCVTKIPNEKLNDFLYKLKDAENSYYSNPAESEKILLGLSEDFPNIIHVNMLLYNLYVRKGNLEEASRFIEKVHTYCLIESSEPDLFMAGRANAYLGSLFYIQFNFEKADVLIDRAISVYKQVEEYEELGECYLKKGSIVHSKGELKEAQKYWMKALLCAKKYKKCETLGPVLANLSRLKRDYAPERSLKLNEIAAGVLYDIGQVEQYLNAINNITVYYMKLQQWENAFSSAEKVYLESERIHYLEGQQNSLQNAVGILFVLAQQIFQWPFSNELIEMTFKGIKNLKIVDFEGDYSIEKTLNLAENMAERSLEMAYKTQRQEGIAQVLCSLMGINILYSKIKKDESFLQKAKNYCEKAKEIWQKANNFEESKKVQDYFEGVSNIQPQT